MLFLETQVQPTAMMQQNKGTQLLTEIQYDTQAITPVKMLDHSYECNQKWLFRPSERKGSE